MRHIPYNRVNAMASGSGVGLDLGDSSKHRIYGRVLRRRAAEMLFVSFVRVSLLTMRYIKFTGPSTKKPFCLWFWTAQDQFNNGSTKV